MSAARRGPTRREALAGAGAAALTAALGRAPAALAPRFGAQAPESAPAGLPVKLAVKYGMVAGDAPMVDKLRLLARLGYDGVELDSPNGYARDEVLRARDASGIAIHGVVDSIHWSVRLSDPDPAVRARAIDGLRTAIEDAHAYAGSSVLLVPGLVADAQSENAEQVRERSIEGIRAVLPRAAELGVRILVENVWNGFCYEHDGPADQTAERFAAYLDELASPWVGMYLDLGNHRKYGAVEQWVRTLGPRIVKLDVKDWSRADGWTRIGEGDVGWPGVRAALAEIGFTGWATAEVAGGDEERLADVLARMREHVVG